MIKSAIDVNNLREALIGDVCKALGISRHDWRGSLLRPFLWLPSQRLANLAATFDQYVTSCGFYQAARWVLPNFIKDLQANNVSMIPTEGPVLIASNHPGTIDSLAIAASVPRADLKIVASAFPFLRRLQATADHLIYTTENIHERMTVLRSAIRHLNDGGSVLIFPSGQLDPDPEIMSGASAALNNWSPSLSVILRRVPQAQVVLAIISGVITPAWYRNPLKRLLARMPNRQRIVEILQVAQQMLLGQKFELVPKITFGSPLAAFNLTNLHQSHTALLQPLLEQARQLLEAHKANFDHREPKFKISGD